MEFSLTQDPFLKKKKNEPKFKKAVAVRSILKSKSQLEFNKSRVYSILCTIIFYISLFKSQTN